MNPMYVFESPISSVEESSETIRRIAVFTKRQGFKFIKKNQSPLAKSKLNISGMKHGEHLMFQGRILIRIREDQCVGAEIKTVNLK